MEEKGKPLMLKELLELESTAESRAGFGWCYPRYLANAAAAAGGGGVVARMSAAIRVGRFLSPSRASGWEGAPSGSFSRRLRGGLWKRGGEGRRSRRVGDAGGVVRRSAAASSKKASRTQTPPRRGWGGEQAGRRSFDGEADAAAAGSVRRSCETEGKITCQSDEAHEEAQQLSPASVMDFHEQYEKDGEEEDDGDPEASPTLQQSLAMFERPRQQVLQKIRHFEMLLADLDTFEPDGPSTATEDLKHHVAELGTGRPHLRILDSRSLVGPAHCFQKFLFSDEGPSSRRTRIPDGRDQVKLRTCGSDLSLASAMEAETGLNGRIGRLKCFPDDERELLAIGLEGTIFYSLVGELVGELC